MSYKDNFCKNLKKLKSENEIDCKQESLRVIPQQFNARRKYLMKKIQEIVIDTIKSINNEEPPSIAINSSRLWKNCEFNEFLTLRSDGESSQQTTSFSAVNSKDKLSKIIFLLSKIYRLLLIRSNCTIRELYYQTVNIFPSQSNLKSALSTVCGVLDAIPWEICLQTTSKGLIAGQLTVTGPSCGLIDFNKSGGVLIPQDIIRLTSFKSNAKFVLVIEKDAVFQKLLDEKALEKLGPCIFITGKGYPDVNTRLMLRRIWEELKLPILALVDCDPYGIDIMCVYRFGSLAMSQQNKMMAVPAIKWLGVHPQDIKELNIKGVQLSNDDTRRAISFKNRPYITSNSNLLNQINMMIESNIKCEIEAFSHISPSYLTDVYIRHKICSMELI